MFRLLALAISVGLLSSIHAAPVTKTKDDGPEKKLVGTWEGLEESKGGKSDTITVEFKADGSIKLAVGPFEMTGTWKFAKSEDKKTTIDTELKFDGLGGKGGDETQKMSFTIEFKDKDTIVMSPVAKPDPKEFKRKK